MYVIIAQVDVVVIPFQRNRVQVKGFYSFLTLPSTPQLFFQKPCLSIATNNTETIAQWIADKAEHPMTLANGRMGVLACILSSIAF